MGRTIFTNHTVEAKRKRLFEINGQLHKLWPSLFLIHLKKRFVRLFIFLEFLIRIKLYFRASRY